MPEKTLVEAVNLSVRTTKSERVLVATSIHPHYRAVLRTYTSGLGLELVDLKYHAYSYVESECKQYPDKELCKPYGSDPQYFARH